MDFLDRFRGPRHPLLAAVVRAERRGARGSDLLQRSAALLASHLFLATFEEVDADADPAPVGRISAEDGWRALAVFLEREDARRLFPDARGELSCSGADACRRARSDGDDLAVFAGRREPAFAVSWRDLTWLGAGVLPNYQRFTGDHEAFRAEGLIEACRTAVDWLDDSVRVILIEAVAADDIGRATLLLDFDPDPSLAEWTAARLRIEGALAREGRSVPVVLAREGIMIDFDVDEALQTANEGFEVHLRWSGESSRPPLLWYSPTDPVRLGG